MGHLEKGPNHVSMIKLLRYSVMYLLCHVKAVMHRCFDIIKWSTVCDAGPGG